MRVVRRRAVDLIPRRRASRSRAARWSLAALTLGVALTAGCTRRTLVLPVRLEPEALPALTRLGFPRTYETAIPAVASILVRELGLPLPRRLTVFVFPIRAAYAAGLASVGEVPPEHAGELATSSIGLGQHRRLFINDEALRGHCRSAWLGLLAHELTHAAQHELSGGRRGRSEQWLREGMAEWVAARVLDRLGEVAFHARRERALRAVAQARPSLEGPPAYRLAFLLTDDLIRSSGFGSLSAYFRSFADSDEQARNFTAAFGVSRDEFAPDALDRMRREMDRVDGMRRGESSQESSHEIPTIDEQEGCEE